MNNVQSTEPKYSDAEIINIAADISTRKEFENVESPLILDIVTAAILAYRPSMPDKAVVSDELVRNALDIFGWLPQSSEPVASQEYRMRQVLENFASQSTKAVPDADIRLAAFTRKVVRELSDSPKSALVQLADAIKAIDGDTQEQSHD